jgi:DNA-binding phage protein
MAKATISKKQKKSKTKYLRVYEPFTNSRLGDPKIVVEMLLECIVEGDSDSFREVLCSYLIRVNKAEFAKKSRLGRRTLYALMDFKKPFNPELSTVSAILKSIAA